MPPVSVTFNFAGPAEAAAFLQSLGTGTQAEATSAAAPQAAPKPPRTRAAPPAAPTVPAAPAAPAAAPVADAEAIKKATIAKLVLLINANDAMGRNGKQVCTDLCSTFGGRNVSAISPDKYPDVIKAVDAAIDALNSDPAA